MENNKGVTDTNVDDIENLKTLLFQDNLTQYGKRKLIEYYEEKIKKLENYINPSKARISYFDTKKGANVVIEGFIPKQKIKDKIEELRKAYEKMEQSSDFIIADTIQPKIEILQELLEESEDK